VTEGGRDDRSPGQRMHDALQDLASIAVRRTELVDCGAPAQVIISLTAEQLTDRAGLAETSFGQHLSVPEALRLADEAAITLLLRDTTGVILNQGRTKRIATRAQTLALTRDKGCSSPALTNHRNGANATTSEPGPTATDRPEQPHPGLRPAPPGSPTGRLGMRHRRRTAGLDPTTLDRPLPKTPRNHRIQRQ
jgi:hypothetical protein